MRRSPLLVALSVAFAAGAWLSSHAPTVFRPSFSSPDSVGVYFSPHGGCTDAVVSELEKAQSSVLVQAYSFTSAPIAEALVAAFQRGVQVQIVLDRSDRTDKYSSADFVAHAKIPTFIDAKHAIAHNKVIIIDELKVLTGSFNFTKAAENSNAENLLVIHDKKLAGKYTENWRLHKEHSVPYTGR